MLRLTCDMKIGNEQFDFVGEVQIQSAWKNLTDTATVKLPRNLVTRQQMKVNEVVKVGQQVSISLGYDLKTSLRFHGYVDAIGAATNELEIKCQDEMWKLKQGSYTKSWANADLDSVISFIKEKHGASWSHEIIGDKVTLGFFKVEGLSGAKVLQKLKDSYGIYCFFRGGKLMCGKPYDTNLKAKNEVVFAYGENVVSWKELVYKGEGDTKLKVNLVNIKPDGTKEESIKGDDDGDERTLHFYNLSKADLDKQAEAIIKQMKYGGYRDKILAFGEPAVNHGDVVVVKDDRMKEREGKYFVDSVETTFGPSGMRQKIELGPKSSNTV